MGLTKYESCPPAASLYRHQFTERAMFQTVGLQSAPFTRMKKIRRAGTPIPVVGQRFVNKLGDGTYPVEIIVSKRLFLWVQEQQWCDGSMSVANNALSYKLQNF